MAAPSPLLRPRWLVGHVLVAVLAVTFIFLGFWQLNRHFDQQRENEALEARMAEPSIGLDQLSSGDTELRTAIVTGRYDYARQLELRPRARHGRVGYDQVVPLITDAGLVLVNRGFIADVTGEAGSTPQFAGEVTVTGTVRASQLPSSFGPQNEEQGPLETIARVDVDRLNPQFGGLLLPVYLDLISETPEVGGLPTVPPEPPEPGSRPHLPYAVQWWSFATVVSVGWVLYLRKQFFTS